MSQLEDAVDIVQSIGQKEGQLEKTGDGDVCAEVAQPKQKIRSSSKDSPVCKERGVQFWEMLPLEDKEAKIKL